MRKQLLLIFLPLWVYAGSWMQHQTGFCCTPGSCKADPEPGQYPYHHPEIHCFLLVLPSGAASLQMSYVGDESQSVRTDAAFSQIILLRTSENSLKRLVVMNYSTQGKADLTGAVSTVQIQKR